MMASIDSCLQFYESISTRTSQFTSLANASRSDSCINAPSPHRRSTTDAACGITVHDCRTQQRSLRVPLFGCSRRHFASNLLAAAVGQCIQTSFATSGDQSACYWHKLKFFSMALSRTAKLIQFINYRAVSITGTAVDACKWVQWY